MKSSVVVLLLAVVLLQSTVKSASTPNNVVVVTPEPERQHVSSRAAQESEFDNGRNNNVQQNRVATEEAKPPGQDEDYDDYVPNKNDVSEFDWRLTKTVIRQSDKNVIISPVSVKLLLSVLGEAAGDHTNTKRELASIVPTVDNQFQSRELFSRIFPSLREKSTNYVFNMATRIYADDFITPLQRYKALLEHHYFTEVKTESFSEADRVTNSINQWVANVTENHIQQLVKKQDVENSVMIMLNAIYFKGIWRKPFNTSMNFRTDFHVSPSVRKSTEFMTLTERFFFVDSSQLNAKILRLPYKGRKFAMFLILPKDVNGIDDLTRRIDSAAIQSAKWYMDEVEVNVVLPKFKFDYTSNLNTVLQELGIKEMFTTQASFPALARGSAVENRLQVSNVIQKAGLIVDEKGSTAYAATEVSLVNKFGDDSVRDFVAKHPFLFVIEDERTGAIIFTGKVQDPTEMV